MTKTIGAAAFKATCLNLIETMGEDGEAVVITKRGKPVALLSPLSDRAPGSIIGALKGSVQHYDDPFAPALDASDWDAAR